jgi:DNA uptake protein ComE-like DNA-binding protein
MRSILHKFIAVAVCAMLFSVADAYGKELNAYANAHWVGDSHNDGDSFVADIGGTSIVVRLYYADCAEKYASSETQARRVREQARYFGIKQTADIFAFGCDAYAFTKKLLAEPFTVHTAFARGGGSNMRYRYLGFVTTAGGEDLARLLVGNGLARARGTGRPSPDGITQAENWEQLRDLESSAMLDRRGIWAKSSAVQLPKGRSEQREEDRVLRAVVKNAVPNPIGAVDVNHANRDALIQLPGVGPVLANKIIEGRPYKSLQELTRIHGIGEKTLQRLEQTLTLGPLE